MPKYRRSRCFEFMLACRTEYDRLVSTDIQPPGFVIRKYKRLFKSVVHKPEVVNVELEQVHVAHGHDDQAAAAAVDETLQNQDLPIRRADPHVHVHGRRHRARRASTVLQDTIIDPGKAMEDGLGPRPVVVAPNPASPPEQPPTTFTSGIASPFEDKPPRGLMDNEPRE